MKMPRATEFDSTLSLLRQGYELVPNMSRKLGSDIYAGRLLLRKAIFMTGEEAARLFYDNEKFQRHDAMPKRVQKTLLGIGGVQGLDDECHRHRKHLFVQQIMAPEKIESLKQITRQELLSAAKGWPHTSQVMLFPELQLILCRAVCQWTGVPLNDAEAKQRAGDLGAMIESGGRVGISHWHGRWARKRSERWLGGLIEKVRSNELFADRNSVFCTIAFYRELNGELLSPQVAAVELLNILRPTVAIARFMIFGALALHEHPQCRNAINHGGQEYLEMFVQEVRRFYPFFPLLAARVRKSFQWKGHHFPKGRRVILDLYGTNHDIRLWQNPHEFSPERFRNRAENAYDFIPQGGGDYQVHHRCPGEWITVELMKMGLDFIAREITYTVPVQNLEIDLKKVPTLPASTFIIEKVRLVNRQKIMEPQGSIIYC